MPVPLITKKKKNWHDALPWPWPFSMAMAMAMHMPAVFTHAHASSVMVEKSARSLPRSVVENGSLPMKSPSEVCQICHSSHASSVFTVQSSHAHAQSPVLTSSSSYQSSLLLLLLQQVTATGGTIGANRSHNYAIPYELGKGGLRLDGAAAAGPPDHHGQGPARPLFGVVW